MADETTEPKHDPLLDEPVENAAPQDNDPTGAETDEVDLGDEGVAQEPQPQFVRKGQRAHFRSSRKGTWRRKARVVFWVVLLISLTVGAWFFVEPVRTATVNSLGLRTKLIVTVGVAEEGKQSAAHLKNAQVTVNGRQYRTDENGTVVITDQPYGEATINVSKSGYDPVQTTRNLGFNPQLGSNDTTIQLSLTAVGMPVSFKVMNWLSGKPIPGGKFQVGDVKAASDEAGLVTLKVPPSDSKKVSVQSLLESAFINKTFDIQLEAAEAPTIEFVPAGKDYFLSNRNGALGVYSANLDGSDVQIVVPGTGREILSTLLTISPDGTYGVLASSRDGAKSEGAPLQRLYLIDLTTKRLTQIDEGRAFTFFAEWTGDTLVYVRQNVGGSSATQVSLRSLTVSGGKTADVEANVSAFHSVITGYQQVVFNETILIKGDPQATQQKLISVDLRNGSRTELAQNTTTIVQTDFDTVAFQLSPDQSWHELNLNTGKRKTIAQPSIIGSRTFFGTPSQDGKRRIIIERIDGKPALIAKTTTEGAEKQLHTAAGLGSPIRWVGNEIIFRITTDSQTADYAISPAGGQPRKISDVIGAVMRGE